MFGIENRLRHREVCASFDLGVETLDFVVKIVGHRIDGNADGKIRCAAESLACPVRALIQAAEDLYQADRIDFVDAAGFRVVADGRRIAGDGKYVANAADSPGAEQARLQTDDVEIARGEMRDGLDTSCFERTSGDEGVHANASHSAAVDVYGVDFFRDHDFVDLLVDAVERKAFGRIDFDADCKFVCLKFFPEFAFRFTLQNGRRFSDRDINRVMSGSRFCRPQRLDGFGHGSNVRGGRAAAAAKKAYAESGG